MSRWFWGQSGVGESKIKVMSNDDRLRLGLPLDTDEQGIAHVEAGVYTEGDDIINKKIEDSKQ